MSNEDEDREGGTAVTAAEETAEKPKRRLELEVDIRDVGPCKKHVKVSIPRAEIERQYKESIKDFGKDTPIPGFRPGRAPRQLVIKRFKKQVVDQVKMSLLMASMEQLDADYELNPITQPNLDVAAIELPEEGPMSFEMDVEVRPEFALPEYKGLSVRRPVRPIGDDDIDVHVRQYLERHGQVVPKLEGTAELGDFATGDLVFHRPDGSVFGEIKEIQFRIQDELRLRDGTIPELGKAIVGANPGETRHAEARMGSSVGEASVRGQTVPVEIRLHDLKQVRLPEIDDAFLDSIGFESMDEVRGAVKDALERQVETQRRQIVRKQILDQLLESTPFDLPSDLVAREERSTISRLVAELRREGISDDQIRASEAAIRANAHESTLRSLKELLLLGQIAKAEEIEVDDDDLEVEIEAMAERSGESVRRVRSRVEKEGIRDELSTQILQRKVIDRILEFANVEDDQAVAVETGSSIETLDHAAAPEVEEPAAEATAEGTAEAESGSAETTATAEAGGEAEA